MSFRALKLIAPVAVVTVLAGCGDSGAAVTTEPTGARAVVQPGAEGVASAPRAIRVAAAPGEVVTLEWDDLIPEDYDPLAVLEGMDVDRYDDYDPRALALMEQIMAEWDKAPVVEALDGKRVRLPGFVVPLEGDGTSVTEFLLVPYYGACIHVPPPPANQMVHVISANAVPIRGLFDTVWVSGELSAERSRSEHGVSGYTLNAINVEPYDE
jgi:uncharacterized protein